MAEVGRFALTDGAGVITDVILYRPGDRYTPPARMIGPVPDHVGIGWKETRTGFDQPDPVPEIVPEPTLEEQVRTLRQQVADIQTRLP